MRTTAPRRLRRPRVIQPQPGTRDRVRPGVEQGDGGGTADRRARPLPAGGTVRQRNHDGVGRRVPRRRRRSRGGMRLAGHEGPHSPGRTRAGHPGADGHRRPRHAGRRTIRPRARSPDSARTARRPGVRGARRVAERGEGPLRTADDGRRTTVAADGRIPRRGRNHPGHLATTGRRGRCERRAGGGGRQANRPR